MKQSKGGGGGGGVGSHVPLAKITELRSYVLIFFNSILPLLFLHPSSIKLLKLINNSSRENKENHYCDRGLDMCS